GQRLAIGADEIRTFGDAAGIGVLDDDAGRGARRVEFGDAFIGRIGVVDVIVGQFAALHLPRRGDARALVGRPIEYGRLVRVFAVAQRLDQPSAKSAIIRCVGLEL